MSKWSLNHNSHQSSKFILKHKITKLSSNPTVAALNSQTLLTSNNDLVAVSTLQTNVR